MGGGERNRRGRSRLINPRWEAAAAAARFFFRAGRGFLNRARTNRDSSVRTREERGGSADQRW